MSLTWQLGPLIIGYPLLYSIIGLLLGAVFYISIAKGTFQTNYQHTQEVMNVLITFIITIFLSKMIILASLLTKSLPAVLAYPADKRIFYTAFILTMLYLAYMIIRKKTVLTPLLEPLIIILGSGQFILHILLYYRFGLSIDFYSLIILAFWMGYLFIVRLAVKGSAQYYLQAGGLVIANGLLAGILKAPFFLYYTDYLFWIVLLIGLICAYMIQLKYRNSEIKERA